MCDELLTQDLLERAKEGDDEAFTRLWERFWPQLLQWTEGRLNGRLQSRLDPEDILQSVFRTFYRHLPSGRYVIEDRGRLWVLLLGIAQNKLAQKEEQHSAQRRDVYQERTLTQVLLATLTTGKPSPELFILLDDELERLYHSLTPSDAEIARLGISGQLSLREIARETGASLGSVRRVMARARSFLQYRLAE